MKKLWLLIIMLLLAACGGGGGSSTPTGGGGDPGGTGMGTLSIEFVDKTAKTAAVTPPAPGWVRIVISHPSLNGRPYKFVDDIAFGAAPVTIPLPVGDGYIAEAVYYAKVSGRNQMSSYGTASGINITEGGNTAVPMSPDPISVTITAVADNAAGLFSTFPNNTYTVTATPGAGLQAAWSLAVSTTPFTSAVHLAHAPATSYAAQVAPLAYEQKTLNFQGEFFIKNSLLKSTDTATDWTFNYDAPGTLTVNVHSGDSTVTPPADTVRPLVASFSVPSTIQSTTTVSPILLVGTDNAEIKGYKITESNVAPELTDVWNLTPPTSHPVAAVPVNGVDTPVTLYAWVKDSTQVSLPVARTVTINNSPVVTRFIIPSLAEGTTIPVTTLIGKNNTGGDELLQYLITQTATPKPTAATPGWSVANTPPASYNVTGITQAAGVSYPVQLFAWVKDANGSVSRSLSNVVTISDAPRVTAFVVPATVDTGSTVAITTFTGAAATGHSIGADGYLITTTRTTPPATAFGVKPADFTFPGITGGGAVSRYIYAWVKDERGVVSLSSSALVRFVAP